VKSPIVNGLVMRIENPAPSEFPLVSLTLAVKVAVCGAVVGIPEIAPVDDIARPSGSEPPVRVQVYCPLPPDATRFSEYAVPAVPGVNWDGLDIVSGSGGGGAVAAAMAIDNCSGALDCRESCAWMENV